MNFTEIFTRQNTDVFLGDVYNLVYKYNNLCIIFEIHKQYIIVDYGIMLNDFDDIYVTFWYEPWKISEKVKQEYDELWSEAYNSKLSVYTDDFLNKIINNQGKGLNKLTQQLIIKIFSTR